MPHIFFEATCPFPVENVFAYRTREGALQRLTPPWQKASIIQYTNTPPQNGECVFLIKEKLLPAIKWKSKFSGYVKNKSYTETLISGPFKKWVHTRTFTKINSNSCTIKDSIEFILPFGKLGSILGNNEVKKNLQSVFEFRYKRLLFDCSLHKKYATTKYTFYISGKTHILYNPLKALLMTGGHKFTDKGEPDVSIILNQEDEISHTTKCINLINDNKTKNITNQNWQQQDQILEYIYSLI